jgi:aspartate/methionine/tyrosine aminotransferase
MTGFSERSAVAVGTNALTQAIERHRAQGRPVLNLSDSNPTSVGLAWNERDLARYLTHERVAEYHPEPFGLLETRRALSAELARQGIAAPPERLLLTASTSEIYGYLFKLLCDVGDEVLVPAPSYPLFDMLSALEGVRLIPYQLAYDGDWHLDVRTLHAARSERTRAILMVHPNNPTGSYLKRDELAQLAALGLPLISDEVFAEYPLRADKERATTALEVADRVLVFRMGGLSKSLVLPQLKLAWTIIAGPDPLADEACERLSHIADTYLSVSTPVQRALPQLLAHGASVRERVKERVLANLCSLRLVFAHSAASVLDVEGGWYAILRLPALHHDEAWALMFLERDGVLVQPGFFYDLSGGTYVVLSLITEEPTFQEGVARLARRIDLEAGESPR